MYCPECELEVRNFKDKRCPFCQAALVEGPGDGSLDAAADSQKHELRELISDVKKKLDEIDSLPPAAKSGENPLTEAGAGPGAAMPEVLLPDADEGESVLKTFSPDEPAGLSEQSAAGTQDTETPVDPEDVERVLETLDGPSVPPEPITAASTFSSGETAISNKPSEVKMLENLMQVTPEEAAGPILKRQKSLLWPVLGIVVVLVVLTGMVGPRLFQELVRNASFNAQAPAIVPPFEKTPASPPVAGSPEQDNAAVNQSQESRPPPPHEQPAIKSVQPEASEIAVAEMPAVPVESETREESKTVLPEAPAVPEKQSPAVARGSALTLQVMSLTNREFVAPALKKLKDKGFPAYMVESKTRKGRPFFKICVGRYASQREADRAAAALRKELQQDCLIVRFQEE